MSLARWPVKQGVRREALYSAQEQYTIVRRDALRYTVIRAEQKPAHNLRDAN
jgi:hypothetical protein